MKFDENSEPINCPNCNNPMKTLFFKDGIYKCNCEHCDEEWDMKRMD